jgi:hypothetical protein
LKASIRSIREKHHGQLAIRTAGGATDVQAALLQSPAGLERVVRYLDAVLKFEVKLPPRSA